METTRGDAAPENATNISRSTPSDVSTPRVPAETRMSTTTGDAVWDRLARLPFFEQASMGEKRKMYEEERAKEAEREERLRALEAEKEEKLRAFELEKMRLEQNPSVAASTQEHRPKVQLPAWEEDTVDSYLEVCESLLTNAGVDEDRWVGFIVPKLPAKARTVFKNLGKEEKNDYAALKRQLLSYYAISPIVYRRNFFQWEKRDDQSYRQFLKKIEEQLHMWIHCVVQPEENPDWEELLLIYRLEQELNDEVRVFMQTQKPQNAEEFVRLADDFVQSVKLSKKAPKNGRTNQQAAGSQKKAQSDAPSTASSKIPDKAAHDGRWEKPRKFCTFCKKKGHTRSECFSDPESPKYRGGPRSSQLNAEARNFQPNNSHAANTCASDPNEHPPVSRVHPAYSQYVGKTFIGSSNNSVTYLRDTGATICLIDRRVITESDYRLGPSLTVSCFNGMQTTYPSAEVKIRIPGRYEGRITAALLESEPVEGVSLIIGNDLAAIAPSLDMPCAVVTRSMAKDKQESPEEEAAEASLGNLFRDAPNEEEVESTASEPQLNHEQRDNSIPTRRSNAVSELTSEEIRDRQESDPTLIPLWGMAGPKEDGCYFVHPENGLLMYLDQTKQDPEGDSTSQIVVPRELRVDLMHWGHDDLTAGHLSEKKTIDRLKQHFTWPGIRRDVQLHCRGCGPCQRLGKGASSNTEPLKSLPVVGKPFDLIAVDVVGPLPKTNKGNRYLITVMDHCTRYLEAFAVPVADAAAVRESLTELFSRNGLCRQILSDRGSVFTSDAFQTFLAEMGVQHLLTSAYRPESNGTLERAHGTIKRMIEASLEEADGQEWDDLLPWILFAHRTAKHSSTGYSPFVLMFGREPITPLGLIALSWMGEIAEPSQVPASEYVNALQSRLQRVLTDASKQEREAKSEQAGFYDRRRKAKSRPFKRGDLVLLHLPVRGKPLVGEWQGPYPVAERLGDQTYLISTPDKRVKKRRLHANAMRPWQHRPGDINNALACPATAQPLLAEGQSLGDLMRDPGPPTELEERYDPGNYNLHECLPEGAIPSTDHLTPEQADDIKNLCGMFPRLFSGPLGEFAGVSHDIDVGDHMPLRQHYYRSSPEKMKIMKAEVDDMLRLKVIQPSKSEWSSPMVLVKQRDKWRPCVDYRRINAITKGESYPIPRLDDLIDQVGNARFVTCLDLSKGYWQVNLSARAREISAITTPFGHFEFLKMPFGLKSAPMTFQRAMNDILHGMSDFAAAYLDDVSIRSNTWEDHLKHLEAVLQRLSDKGVTLNSKKCTMGCATVKYLGYQVGSGQVSPISAKIEAIKQIPPPKNKKEL